MIIRIGTRRSALALAQTAKAANALKTHFPNVQIQTVEIVTHGDRQLDKPLNKLGGKGVFVTEIENSLLSGEIDMAVHSAKDLPLELADGLEIAGVLPRGDSRDMLITRQGVKYGFEEKFTVGTGSERRRRNFSELYPNAVFKDIRGNVDTRLKKLENGEYDGIILCAAGIERLKLNMDNFSVYNFSCDYFIPAPCQGIIAVECAKGSAVSKMLNEISDPETTICFRAEREIISRLGADCSSPVGAYTQIEDDMMIIYICDTHGRKIFASCLLKDYLTKIGELTETL